MQAAITSASGWVKTLLLLLAALAVILEGGPAWAAAPGSPWGANYFPNVPLTTQDGKTVRFYDDLIKGKVFAINFIYTHCVDSCPLETAALRKVQQALGDRMGRDVHFYTVSIDAQRDKPEVLKAYADKYRVGPGWTFLSGSKADVTLIRQKLGMYRDDGKQEKNLGEHNINVLMGNEAGGQWIKRSPFEETGALVRILGTRLQSARSASGAMHPVAALLPQARSEGEKLFRSHCAACHGTGHEDGIGPGLAGITQKRERRWLSRWIREPDKLLAQKDPQALALFKQYKEVYMPNLRLGDADAEALIDYLANADALAQVAR